MRENKVYEEIFEERNENIEENKVYEKCFNDKNEKIAQKVYEERKKKILSKKIEESDAQREIIHNLQSSNKEYDENFIIFPETIVRSYKKCYIPARSEKIILAQQTDIIDSENAIFNPLDLEIPGILASRVLYKVNNNKKLFVLLMNVTTKRIELQPGKILGYAVPINNSQIIETLYDATQDNTHEVNNTQTSSDNFNIINVEKQEKLNKEEFLKQFNLTNCPQEGKEKLEQLLYNYEDIFESKHKMLGLCKYLKFSVDVNNHPPINLAPYIGRKN
jgi:hypothetical protein